MAFDAAHPLAMVVFSHPWWLVGLAAAAIPPAAAVWARRRGRHIPAVGVAIQMLAVALAAGALAGPAAPMAGRADRPYLVLRDVSGSTRGQHDRPLPWPPDVPKEVFHFAGTVSPSDGSASSDAMEDDQTQLAPALRLAVARAAQLAGVVIHTDGRFRDADPWPAAARALARAGAEVLIVPMESPPPDARVADMTVSMAADGARSIRVTVAANAPLVRTLTVKRRGVAEPMLERRLSLLPDNPATLRLRDTGATDRAVVYEASIEAGDEFPENDSASAVSLPVKQRVVLVGARPEDLGLSAEAGLGLATLKPPEVPDAAAGWLDYSAVILVDAKGDLLSPSQRRAAERYVRSGGGLVLIGAAPHAEPADRLDPLTRVSALVANPYERRPMDIVVALDASGSMAEGALDAAATAGRSRFEAAAEATLSLKRHLTSRDSLEVITFSDSARRLWRSEAGALDFASLRDALSTVRPRGPTDVMAALTLAAEEPQAKERIGLVILLSDLVPTKPVRPAEAAGGLRRSGKRLAVVGTLPPGKTPPETAPLLELARQLGAPVVTRDRLTGLAEVFAEFLKGARGSAVRRGRFTAGATGIALGADLSQMPALDAYLLSGAPEQSEVILRLAGDAVLARRRAGLGRTVCFAVPLSAERNAALRGSPFLGRLVAGALRWALRRGDDPRFAVRAERTGGELAVEVTCRGEAGPMNGLKLTARVVAVADRGAPEAHVRLAQTGPGRYQGRLAVGAGAASLVLEDEAAGVVHRRPVHPAAPDEFAHIGADHSALQALAEQTGGAVVPARALQEVRRRWRERTHISIWPYVLAVAVVLMLLEWCLMRVWRKGV